MFMRQPASITLMVFQTSAGSMAGPISYPGSGLCVSDWCGDGADVDPFSISLGCFLTCRY